jgi:hypothetical protein
MPEVAGEPLENNSPLENSGGTAGERTSLGLANRCLGR